MSNVLLIEDEDSIRRVLKKVLHEDNQTYKFTEAVDGQEGISMVKKQEFDLILCDIWGVIYNGHQLHTKGVDSNYA